MQTGSGHHTGSIFQEQKTILDMSNNIKTGDIVRFAVIIESCDENIRFEVIDDYGPDCNRCKVQLICNLPIPPTYVYFKEDLIMID